MSRVISKAEGFEVAYKAFQNINFNAFDYHTIKQSMVDYVKLYFPENFNDFIESSEFIALLELFAYLGELVAYRQDVNAQENLLDFAQRKQSVLRLAKFISYKASRNIPARGLVKIESVSTTERIMDTTGAQLGNRIIKWNDQNNPNWKDQFLTVMNRVFLSPFGTVSSNDRVQVNDVLFELYSLDNRPLQNNTIKYHTAITGTNYDMELVSSTLTSSGPEEARPQHNAKFNILYGSDGLGDSSATTGFFMFTKQGSLQYNRTMFDGIIPNQIYDVLLDNVNETDVWVNKVDPDTSDTMDDGTGLVGKSGEWVEVDIANSENIMFNTNPSRNKFEIETLENDRIRLIFGDGEFSDIPSGTFDVWCRTSVNDEIYIPQSGVVNKSAALSYVDRDGRNQTLRFTFSLINSLQNNSPSEDIEQIRRNAPAIYYTQDRMVNGRDYNSFPLRDPSILKLRAINRTFAGESNYERLMDSSSTYQDIKLFGTDLSVFFNDTENSVTAPPFSTSAVLLQNFVEPILYTIDFLVWHNVSHPDRPYRRQFTPTERTNIIWKIDSSLSPWPIGLYYNGISWFVEANATDTLSEVYSGTDPDFIGNPTLMILMDKALDNTNYTIRYHGMKLIAESASTNFFNDNDDRSVISLDTLQSNRDVITILKANTSSDPNKLLPQDEVLNIIRVEKHKQGLNLLGLPNLHQVAVSTMDRNLDTIPDNILLPTILDCTYTIVDPVNPITTPDYYVVGYGDVSANYAGGSLTVTEDPSNTGQRLSNQIEIDVTNVPVGEPVTVHIKQYVYFKRDDTVSQFESVDLTFENMSIWAIENDGQDSPLRIRRRGRGNLNFLWMHRAGRFNIVDPTTTNINDMFVVTRSYYNQYQRWLRGEVPTPPRVPSSTELFGTYAKLLDNKMISDTVIMHPGKIKLLFGAKAQPELRASIKVIKSKHTQLTDNQVKIRVVNAVRDFFNISVWEFGETFYYSELDNHIQQRLKSDIVSTVLVPAYTSHTFGELYQVMSREDEILQVDVSIGDIEVVNSLNAVNIRQST